MRKAFCIRVFRSVMMNTTAKRLCCMGNSSSSQHLHTTTPCKRCLSKNTLSKPILVAVPVWTYGGTEAARGQCLFPFTYNGTVYNECTTAGRDRPWCAVTGGRITDSFFRWGYCTGQVRSGHSPSNGTGKNICQTTLFLWNQSVITQSVITYISSLRGYSILINITNNNNDKNNDNNDNDRKKLLWRRVQFETSVIVLLWCQTSRRLR